MEIKRPPSVQPVPDHAECVFKGEIFDVYQWEQKMYDGSTAIFEKAKRADTVVVFPVTTDGKIIMTKQEQPGVVSFVGAPGGRVDPGEGILAAAKRELLEESGYEANELIHFKSVQPATKIDWAVHVFIAKGLTKVGDLQLDPGEKIQLVEYDFEDFLQLATQESFEGHKISFEVFQALLDKSKMEDLKKAFT